MEPIGASAATVILGLLCLLLSELGNTRGLGPVGAIGIAGAVVAALTFLPAVLLLVGRRVFWPLVPRVDHAHAEDAVGSRGVWGRVAGMVGRHPRRTWVVTLRRRSWLLGGFVPTFKADGVTPVAELFLDEVESVTGQEVLGRSLPGRVRQPGRDRRRTGTGPTPSVATVKRDVDASEAAVVPARPRGPADGRRRQGAGAGHPAPGGRQPGRRGDRAPGCGRELDTVGTDVLVGGSSASNLDVKLASERDLRVIIPAILLVILVVLMLLLRSVVAPVLLVLANVVSFAATLGVAALVVQPRLRLPRVRPLDRRSTRSCSSSRWASTTRSS